MGNNCKVKNCHTNYQNHENGTVCRLPKDPEVRERWMKFWIEKMSNDSERCLFVRNILKAII